MKLTIVAAALAVAFLTYVQIRSPSANLWWLLGSAVGLLIVTGITYYRERVK